MNKYILLGRLLRDVELKQSKSGLPFVQNALASTLKDDKLIIDVVLFGKTAEILHKFVKKGDRILAEGELKLDEFTTKEGEKRRKHTLNVRNFSFVEKVSKETKELEQEDDLPF